MLSVLSEILFLFLLIILNGLFAMSEIAIVSDRKTHLEKLSARGDRAAKMALKLANNPNRILSTVKSGNYFGWNFFSGTMYRIRNDRSGRTRYGAKSFTIE